MFRTRREELNGLIDTDGPRLSAPQLAVLHRPAWDAMTKEEQIEITRDAVKELEERRDMEDTTLHNVPMAAFNDTRSTLQACEKEVSVMMSIWMLLP